MVELVDTQDLGSCAVRCEGSNPFPGTFSRDTRLGVLRDILFGGRVFSIFEDMLKLWFGSAKSKSEFSEN